MSQRVNIQYSIDMDDLDFELERLLTRSKDCMKETNAAMESLAKDSKKSGILSSENVRKISDIRENLAKVDFTLSDINKIVSSYITYQLSLEEEEQPGEAEQAAPQPPPPPMPSPTSDIYPPAPQATQGYSPENIEMAANQLQETLKNGGVPFPADLDPEVLAQKLEQFKKSMKNA